VTYREGQIGRIQTADRRSSSRRRYDYAGRQSGDGTGLRRGSRASLAQLDEAVTAAAKAFPAWAATSVVARRALLVKIAETVEAHENELARLLVREHGMPLPNACGEVTAFVAELLTPPHATYHIVFVRES